jgi:tetratricopeptide (TPR) repeat protein
MVQWENQLKALDPALEEAQRIRDIIDTGNIMLDDLEKNYIMTLPTVTFKDRMTLDLGDLTLKLIYFGEGRHTGDDIMIHCPEEKLLFTGDLFYKGSMQIAYGPQFDAPRWIDVLNEVLQNENEIEWVYDCHNGRMTRNFLALWRDYLVDMWKSLNTAKDEGLRFKAVQDHYSYDKKFTYLQQSGLDEAQLRRDHQESIRFVWQQVSGMQSAETVLERVISESGIEKALVKYREMRANKEGSYLFNEHGFNTLGYRLMGTGRINEAIEIFKINVESYPNSWNVYDSLGEAYMNNGDTKLAIKNYEKSIDLNPDNENGKMMLKRIKEGK